MQGAPSALQGAGPHSPFGLQMAEQHCSGIWQGSPSARQVLGPQMESVHRPEQH